MRPAAGRGSEPEGRRGTELGVRDTEAAPDAACGAGANPAAARGAGAGEGAGAARGANHRVGLEPGAEPGRDPEWAARPVSAWSATPNCVGTQGGARALLPTSRGRRGFSTASAPRCASATTARAPRSPTSTGCRFILFHGKRHLSELGAAEVSLFLSHLAVVDRVSASTQNQALISPISCGHANRRACPWC